VNAAPAPDRGAIAFAEKVLTMLAEGRFTATYKYAVLLGLMDLCLEHSTRTGAAPQSVTTQQLAEKILEIYWPHVAPFGQATDPVLLQNSGKQAGILSAILRFRAREAPDPSTPLTRARASAPDGFRRLMRQIEWKLVEMPLPRLQVVGDERDAFLYTIAWNEGIKRGEFNDDDHFDNLIRFVGQAGDHLIRLSGLLRPLIQRDWAAFVARLNAGVVPELGLEQFLFGADRVATAPLRDPLRDLAEGRCFYCNGRLRSDFEIDHFIPWARYANNGLENLVVSDRSCNNAKRDHLAATDHVEHWLARAAAAATDIDSIASRLQWDHHPERSLGVARSIYLRLPEDSRLWSRKKEFVTVDRERLSEAFAGAAAEWS